MSSVRGNGNNGGILPSRRRTLPLTPFSMPQSPWVIRLQLLSSAAGLLIVAAVLWGIVHTMFPDLLQRTARAEEPRAVKEWSALRQTGHRAGPASAKLEIVEFTDFQCPACARMAITLHDLAERYPGRMTVVFRHFPLQSIHPLAMPAAIASECAADAGAFESFHDEAFRQQDSLGLHSFAEMAANAGVSDTTAFNVCLTRASSRQRVERDIAAGASLGLSSTPTLVINGTWYPHSLSATELEQRLRNAQ